LAKNILFLAFLLNENVCEKLQLKRINAIL
jgi:hypothetical protein